MYNKKVLSEATKNLNSTKAPAKKKDMIVDPMGQWKHPGENTRIPGNDITMQGVPYPVWAVPNVGTPQMMYPEQDYYFPGADHVDEYPQMQKGGDISIPELNQYEDGGEYDLTQEEIDDLIAQGYQVKDVDTDEYKKGGFQDDLGKHRQLLRDWTYGQSIGMLQKAQLGLIKSPYQLPAGTKYPMQVVKQQAPKNVRRQYNALEDVKPQVSESTKPKQTFKPNVNLKDAVQIKKDELNAAAFLVSQDPLLSEKQKTDIITDTKKLEDNIYRIYTENPSSIKQVAPQTKSSRVWEYVTNPFTALEYEISGGGAENMPRNINKMRAAGIDPGVVQGRNVVGNTLNEVYNLADAADKVGRYTGQGNYIDAGVEALRFLPGARLSTGLGKKAGTYLKGKNISNVLPGESKPIRSGLGGMDMSAHKINNPDYYIQLLDSFTSSQLSPSSKKLYKGIIESVKKQNGIATQRQYNELQRLKSGNFNYGKKEEGGETDYEDLDLTPEEIDWYLANGYEVEDLGEV